MKKKQLKKIERKLYKAIMRYSLPPLRDGWQEEGLIKAKKFEMATPPGSAFGPGTVAATISADRMKPNAGIRVTVRGEQVSDFGYEFGFTDGPLNITGVHGVVAQARYDAMHRRAQRAEGNRAYLYKSLRRYEKMLEQAYLIIGTEIGRGTRLVMDPVPLIKDAQLMPAFKSNLHSGYKAGESLSPELKHGEKTILVNTYEVDSQLIDDYPQAVRGGALMGAMKFRKKPVVIEAVRYNGNPFDLSRNFAEPIGHVLNWHVEGQWLGIDTLEGEMRVSAGDWVIKGVNGEVYPCKPDIFEKTYEAVE